MSARKGLLLKAVSLGDQVCFSLASFILSILLARYFSEEAFAAFVLGLSIALIIQGVQRNLYIVQNAVLAPNIFRRRARTVMGQHYSVSAFVFAVQSVVTVCIFAMSDTAFYHHVALASVVCTALHGQLEFDRITLLKHDRYVRAASLSVLFFLYVLVMFWSVTNSETSFEAVMGMVLLFVLVKAGLVMAFVGAPDFILGLRLLRRDAKTYLSSALLGVVGHAGYSHIPVMILGAVAQPLQTAAFGAMRGLTQPLQIMVRSMDVIDKNLFHDHLKRQSLLGVILHQTILYALMSWAVISVLLFWGENIIALTYGEKYTSFHDVLVGWSFIFATCAFSLPLETAIISTKNLNRFNVVRLWAGCMGTVLAFAFAVPYGAMGIVVACLAGRFVVLLIGWGLLFPHLKQKAC